MLILGENCLKIGSGATPRGGKEVYSADGPISLIRSQNIYNEGFNFNGLARISTEQAKNLENVKVFADDILLNITGDSVARACIVDQDALPARVNQHVAIIRTNPEKINPLFLRYYLITPTIQNHLLALSSAGATRNALTKAMIESLLIPNYTLQKQRTIASILAILDDKIDLNRRTNETLEAMARALFRDWFVDFGPTRAKMAGEAPYLAPELWELFPDRLDDEGKPEGWKICNFDELVSINPKEPLSRNTIAPYLSMSELPTQGCLTEAPIPRPFSGGSKFRNEDTLFARITPCLENGKTALAQNLENNIVGWGSTEFHVLRGKGNVPFSWVYLMARDNEFRANAIRGMTGTSGRQRVASEVLATYKTVTPSGNQIWKAFDHACNPLFEKIIINGAESRPLAQLRDLLLPKLMSGEISIRDAEKMVENAA